MGGGDKTEKTTIMVLKVDLQCPSCYKKAKNVLCKMPQVRDQVYDEKANTVTITVVCCSPENVRDKLCYKGGKSIKSIEIKEPAKPKAPEKSKDAEKSKGPEKPKDPEAPKPPEKPKDPEEAKKITFEKLKDPEEPKVKAKVSEKPTVVDKPKQKEPKKPEEGTKAAMVATPWAPESLVMMPVQGYPQQSEYPQPTMLSYWGPCYTPAPPDPYYGNYSYGYGPGPSEYGPGLSGYGKGCYLNSDYFNEENASGCRIM